MGQAGGAVLLLLHAGPQVLSWCNTRLLLSKQLHSESFASVQGQQGRGAQL